MRVVLGQKQLQVQGVELKRTQGAKNRYLELTFETGWTGRIAVPSSGISLDLLELVLRAGKLDEWTDGNVDLLGIALEYLQSKPTLPFKLYLSSGVEGDLYKSIVLMRAFVDKLEILER